MPGLPHTATPVVEQRKVLDYLLASDHPQGGAKARFFEAFGFEREHWERLAAALVRHGVERELQGERHGDLGVKYEVVCAIETPDGRAPCITSIWIVEGARSPRLVTAYPAPQG